MAVFWPLEFKVQNKKNSEIIQTLTKGINATIDHLYGSCAIEIPIPSLLSYLAVELTAPFYIL
jgi:hypothetical protein